MSNDPYFSDRARYLVSWKAGSLALASGNPFHGIAWLIQQKEIIRISKAIPKEQNDLGRIVQNLALAFEDAIQNDSWSVGNGFHLNVEIGDVPELVLVQTPYPKAIFDYQKVVKDLSSGRVAIGEEFWCLMNEQAQQPEYEMLDLGHSYFQDFLEGCEWHEAGEPWDDLFCYQAGLISIAGGHFISKQSETPLLFTTTESGEIIGNCLLNDRYMTWQKERV